MRRAEALSLREELNAEIKQAQIKEAQHEIYLAELGANQLREKQAADARAEQTIMTIRAEARLQALQARNEAESAAAQHVLQTQREAEEAVE